MIRELTEQELIAMIQPLIPNDVYGQWLGENATTEAAQESFWWKAACRALSQENERLKESGRKLHELEMIGMGMILEGRHDMKQELRALKDELDALKQRLAASEAAVADADLLFGAGWLEAVAKVKGENGSVAGALAVQVTKLAGDVTILEDRLSASEACAAAMRAAIKSARKNVVGGTIPDEDGRSSMEITSDDWYLLKTSLQSDAGLAIQRRLEAGEKLREAAQSALSRINGETLTDQIVEKQIMDAIAAFDQTKGGS